MRDFTANRRTGSSSGDKKSKRSANRCHEERQSVRAMYVDPAQFTLHIIVIITYRINISSIYGGRGVNIMNRAPQRLGFTELGSQGDPWCGYNRSWELSYIPKPS